MGSRGSRQEEVNRFQVVDSLQSFCHSPAGEGTETKAANRFKLDPHVKPYFDLN